MGESINAIKGHLWGEARAMAYQALIYPEILHEVTKKVIHIMFFFSIADSTFKRLGAAGLIPILERKKILAL